MSTDFPQNPIANLKTNYTQPPLKRNLNVQEINSNEQNIYNNYQNFLNNTNKELYNKSQTIQNFEKREKNNKIELNIILKQSESKTKIELVKININQYLDKQSRLLIQITNPNDPLFLFSLEMTEIEYSQFKSDQNLLVDFKKFPDYVLKMLNLCKNDKEDKYSCVLNISGGENNINLDSNGILIVEEKTEYRKIELLILKLQKANDIILKKYLSNISKEYKKNYESLLQKYNKLNENFKICQKENKEIKENLKKKMN